MRAMLNASTLVVGGALQVCVNVLHEMAQDSTIEWYYALSPEVDAQRRALGVALPQARVVVVKPSPSRSLRSRRTVAELARSWPVDVVFTLFGPAYVDFEQPHLLGVADPWVTHSTWLAYVRLRSVAQYLRKIAWVAYRGRWFLHADAWVVEADAARDGLHRRWRRPLAHIDVVPNNCGDHFRAFPFSVLPQAPSGIVDVLTLSAYYPHKQLELIPAVAAELREMGHGERFRFNLTLDPDGDGWRRLERLVERLEVGDVIVNHGAVSLADAPAMFERCHLMFLPSVLETFSASYPEAMAAGRPIVTSDLDFARSNCREAACYFRAGDARAAALALERLVSDPALWQSTVLNGHRRLAELPTARQKYRLYAEALKKLLARLDDTANVD